MMNNIMNKIWKHILTENEYEWMIIMKEEGTL